MSALSSCAAPGLRALVWWGVACCTTASLAAGTAQVSATGSGTAVSIQGNSNQVTVGAGAKELKAVQKDTAQILQELLKLNKGNEREGQLAKENEQLKAQLAELSERLAQATQPGSTDRSAQAAVQALAQGQIQPTVDYLTGAERQAQADIARADAAGKAARSSAAANARQLAAISPTADAVAALRRATDYEPGNRLNWWLLGDALVQAGQLGEARVAYQRLQALVLNSPAHDRDGQRDLSVSHNKIGDVQVAQGELAGALASYRKGLAIREKLAGQDAGNTQWQRDLSVSHERIGDVQVAQGELAGALASYRKGLAIREKLAGQDAGNTQWQRDLSVSHNKIGDVQVAQGELAGALASYRKGLAIAEKLAGQDAGNVVWQTDVVVSCWKLARLKSAPRPEAIAWLQRGLAVLQPLAAQGRLTAAQQAWPGLLRQRLAELQAQP